MYKLLILLIVILMPETLPGQMYNLPNQFQFNLLSVNPAYAGSDNAISATINYRNQWTGFDDAPKNSLLAIHSPLNGGRIGVGLQIENQSLGIYKTSNFVGNYAYRTAVKGGTLALGLGFGVTVTSAKWNTLQAIHNHDLLLPVHPSSAVMPLFSFGMYYYSRKYYVGISLPSFLSYVEGEDGAYKPKNDIAAYNYFLNGGFNVDLNADFNFRTSALIGYRSGYSTQIYLNSMLGYKEKVWVGLGYRTRNVIFGMLQCQLNYQLRLAYSYDFSYGGLGEYLNGSHEIGLNYVFRYSRKMLSPRSF